MIFSFENVGIVKSAKIEVKGLTIITGLNDTGKSFISKSMYSTIKTINDAGNSEMNYIMEGVEPQLRSILTISRLAGLDERFYSNVRSTLVNALIQKLSDHDIAQLLKARKDELDLELKKREAILPQLPSLTIQSLTTQSNLIFDAIKIELKRERNALITYFDRVVIQQLFRSQFNSLTNKENVAIINCEEGGANVAKIMVRTNQTLSFTANPQFYYQDATLIDSPIILQLSFYLRQRRVGLNYANTDIGMPTYYLDLLTKLPTPPNPISLYPDILKSINDLVGGNIIYRAQTDNYVYEKKSPEGAIHQIQNFNIATGIKSFGIIQLLLKSGTLNNKTVLFIDEPEVHLHPKWEVEYAKIIIAICEAGIPVVISSHSPYFIYALSLHSEKSQIKDKTKFYFGRTANDGSTFEDVTDDLTPIFSALATPMRNMFIK
jgi:predicted ATPase